MKSLSEGHVQLFEPTKEPRQVKNQPVSWFQALGGQEWTILALLHFLHHLFTATLPLYSASLGDLKPD